MFNEYGLFVVFMFSMNGLLVISIDVLVIFGCLVGRVEVVVNSGELVCRFKVCSMVLLCWFLWLIIIVNMKLLLFLGRVVRVFSVVECIVV